MNPAGTPSQTPPSAGQPQPAPPQPGYAPQPQYYTMPPQGYAQPPVYGYPAPPPGAPMYAYAPGAQPAQPPEKPANATKAAKAKARRGEKMQDDAFEYVEKELTMSQELIDRLPKYVRDWTPDHVQDWLAEIFSGTKDLPSYIKSFKDLGVRGIDLLAADDDDLESFGITVPLHISRARTCINQLRNDQKRKEDIATVEKSEQRYTDLKEKYEKQKERASAYTLPRKIEFWKTLDVFTFLKMQETETEEDVSMFIKPFALGTVHGCRLNELRKQETWEDLPGLDANERDIKVLKRLLLSFERREEDKFKRIQELKKRKQRAGLVTIQPDAIRKKELIDQGSSGRVYFGTYERKKVSIKVIKIRKASADDLANKDEDAEAREVRIQERRIADMMYEAKMTYEAYKACGSGVVKLFGMCINVSEPMLVMQYLCNKSVEHELHAADADKEDSIFHISNEQNIRDAENGVKNPILLQVVRIARDIASALSKLHNAGIVHLDIAARNILLDATKRPKIADFGGAAKESELVDLYNLKKRVLDEGSRLYKDDDEMEVDYEMSRDMLNQERSLADDNTLRIYDMPARDRYVRHMPLWVVDCGEHNNPLLDRHADVYSFGCFLFEMITHKVPHPEVHPNSPEEIIDKKLSGNGNPIVPASVDSRLTRLMASCWEEYDEQPSMASIAKELAELHTSMSTESTPLDNGYNKFKDLAQQSANPSNMVSFSAAPRRSSMGIKKNIGDDMIRFEFPSYLNIDMDERIVEYQGTGIKKNQLEHTLVCALRHRDDRVLLLHLQCICVENRDVQIEMICVCMDYLAILADDEHSSTDEDGKWQTLCEGLAQVLNTALLVVGSSGGGGNSVVLDGKHQLELLRHGMPTISALLGRKTLDEDTAEDSPDDYAGSLVRSLCDLVCRSLVHFHGDNEVVETAASVIGKLVELTPIAMRQLHNEGVVTKLIDVTRENQDAHNTVLQCVKALGAFPLKILLEPEPVKVGIRERVQAPRNAAARSRELVEALSRNWKAVLQAVVEVIVTCCKRLEEAKGNLYLTTDLLSLLEASCLMIFRSCEACSYTEQDVIERFFYSADDFTVAALATAIRAAPDHFRIQEGAIGALGHLLSTGHMEFTDSNKLHTVLVGGVPTTPFTLVPRATSAEDRIKAYLSIDPSLNLLLMAMDKFRLNDKISTGIATTTSTSGRKYSSTATMSKYSPLSQTTTKTSSQMTNTSILNDYERGQKEGELLFEAMEFDKDGERKTAASIQSNVAIVIGYACIHHKDVQQQLVRTRYNDMILTSFRNFSNDKCLIEYGCRAFYWTCRRNTMHQLMLLERQILHRLFIVLKKFSDEWTVLNAVICTVLGLLEPPDEAYIEQTFPGDDLDLKEVKKSRPVPRENCTGLKVVQELMKNRGDGDTVFEYITFRVFEFISLDETEQLTANYLRLVTSMMYWLPGVVENWTNEGVVNFSKNQDTMQAILLKVLVHRKGREEGIAKAQEVKRKKVLKEIEARAMKGAKTETAPAKMTADKSPIAGNPKELAASLKDAKLKKTHALILEEFEKKNNSKDTACILTFILVALELPIALLEVATITVNWHDSSADVLAAGLAIVLQLYQAIIISAEIESGIKYPIGCILPYSTCGNLRAMRNRLSSQGFIQHCLFAKDQQLDHPILIRYSLWMLLLLISEPKNDDDSFSPDNPCSDICLAGAPEWIVEVMKRYDDFYSLQVLSAMFLVRAEEQGALINRSIDTLEDMRECAMRARDRPMSDFKQFFDEGEDTYLIGQPLLVLGELQVHADRLIRAVEKHILPVAPEFTAGDICTQQSFGTTMSFGTALSFGPTFTAYVPAPKKIDVLSAETEESATGERFIAYTLLVQWTEDTKWSISYRYRYFRDLHEGLEREFAHLAPLGIPPLGKLGPLGSLNKRSPKLLESRKLKLQEFFNTVMETQARVLSSLFQSFLEVEKNIAAEDVIVPKKLPDLAPSQHNFPVNSIVVDEILGLTFAGSGLLKTSVFDRDRSKIRGEVAIFITAEQKTLSSVQKVDFNSGVAALAWDSRRRCLCVGFSSGAISFYYLTTDNTLQYCAEIDVHTSCLVYMHYDPMRESLISVSQAGMLAAYDMKEGIFTSQTTLNNVVLTSGAFDPIENILFCGTAMNSVMILNLNNNPPGAPVKVETLNTLKPAPVASIAYVESTRLLYVGFKHQVQIYKISGSLLSRNLSIAPWAPSPVLRLNMTSVINRVGTFHGGNFVFVSCECGGIAVFDMRDEKPVQNDHHETPTTTKGTILPWGEVANTNCTTICDWLRASGKNSSSAANRTELLRLLKNTVSATSDALSQSLAPKIRPIGNVLFSWKMAGNTGDRPDIRICALCMSFVDGDGVILVGRSSGGMSVFDVSKFMRPFESLDKQQLDIHLSSFPRLTETVDLIKGSKKTTRGKKHHIPPLG